MFRQRKRRRNEEIYLQRLAEIDATEPDGREFGPTRRNFGRGQVDFLGAISGGEFDGYFVVLEALGGPNAEVYPFRKMGWLESSDILDSVEEFWATFLRPNDLDPYRGSELEWTFSTWEELDEFLHAHSIRWNSAVDSYNTLRTDGWSPDWLPFS